MFGRKPSSSSFFFKFWLLSVTFSLLVCLSLSLSPSFFYFSLSVSFFSLLSLFSYFLLVAGCVCPFVLLISGVVAVFFYSCVRISVANNVQKAFTIMANSWKGVCCGYCGGDGGNYFQKIFTKTL